MNKITFLLALKDRSNETKTWLKTNIFEEFDYFIADGSLDNTNEKIFENINKKNIHYVRFPQDINYNIYYNKIYQSSLLIKTPYVMQIDNDDYINPVGIKECINFMEKNKKIDFIQGYISGVNIFDEKYFISNFKEYDCQHLQSKISSERIYNLLNSYRILWYSIYKKELFQKVWFHCKEISCNNLPNNEYLHGLLSLTFGNFKFEKAVTYIRQTNSKNSVHRSISEEQMKKYQNEIYHVLEYIKKISNIDKELDLKNIFDNKIPYKNKRNIFLKIIYYFLRKKSYSINNIRKINNLFCNLKNN